MNADPAETIFGTESPDLFAALKLTRAATSQDVRSSYRKLALLCHPDKVPVGASEEAKADARRAFERVGYAYAVLSDEKRRKRYEDTGRTDEGFLVGGDEASWAAYFKDLWSGEVNAATIDAYLENYRDSEQELEDLHAAYHEFNGDFDLMVQAVPGAEPAAEQRLASRIDASIASGDLTPMPKWTESKNDAAARERRVRSAEGEAQEAEELAKELGVHDELFGSKRKASTKSGKGKGKQRKKSQGAGDKEEEVDTDGEATLKALMQKRQAGKFDSLIAQMEAKALAEDQAEKERRKARGGRGKKRKPAQDEQDNDRSNNDEAPKGRGTKRAKGPPLNDEEFEKFQKDLFGGRDQTDKQINGEGSRLVDGKSKGSKGRKGKGKV